MVLSTGKNNSDFLSVLVSSEKNQKEYFQFVTSDFFKLEINCKRVYFLNAELCPVKDEPVCILDASLLTRQG